MVGFVNVILSVSFFPKQLNLWECFSCGLVQLDADGQLVLRGSLWVAQVAFLCCTLQTKDRRVLGTN